MRLLFWLFAACVLGLAVHAATLLYAPKFAFERNVDRQLDDTPVNSFFVLSPAQQAALLPDYPPTAVFGGCRFDLRRGPVFLDANFPPAFWTLTVHSMSGKTLYTANDRQSGVDSFRLRLVKAPGLIEMFTAKEEDDAISTSGWKVSSSEPTGLALLWVPAADPAMRGPIAAALSQSRCGRE
jgi:uncharacterized membrane protein